MRLVIKLSRSFSTLVRIVLEEQLTLGSPHRFHYVKFHHENDRGDDDSRQGGLRNVVQIGCEELQRYKHQETSIDATKSRLHSGRVIDCTSTETAAHRH